MTIVLIGGTSHTGKSTVAAAIAGRLGTQAVSTDSLGRHPGRPWPVAGHPVKPHVAAHYAGLPPPQLLRAVTVHYRNLWPRAEHLIAARAASGAALVLEGSALLPECVAALSGVRAVWLVAGDALLRRRILAGSFYDGLDGGGRRLVDSFLARTILFERWIESEVRRLGLAAISIGEDPAPDELAERCLGAA